MVALFFLKSWEIIYSFFKFFFSLSELETKNLHSAKTRCEFWTQSPTPKADTAPEVLQAQIQMLQPEPTCATDWNAEMLLPFSPYHDMHVYLPALPFPHSQLGWEFKTDSASLNPPCGVPRGRTSATLCCTLFPRWSKLSNSRLCSHSLFFPGKLGRLVTSIWESKDRCGSL